MKKGYLLTAALVLVLMVFQVPEAKAATEWNKKEDAIEVETGPYTFHGYTSVDDKSCWIYWIEINPYKADQATELTIPSELMGRTVTRIGYDIPDDRKVSCYNNLFGIKVEMLGEEDKGSDGYLPKLENLTKIEIPDTVEQIEATCFAGVKYLKSIELPPNVKNIKIETFYGCENLEKIVLPKSLESINVETFEKCSKLNDIQISSESENFEVKYGILIEKKTNRAIMTSQAAETVTIPKGVKVLGRRFLAYGIVKKVVIPASVKKMEMMALDGKYIQNISIAKSNKYYGWDGQCMYHKKKRTLLMTKVTKKGYLRISKKVKYIKDMPRVLGPEVKALVIPASVKKISASMLVINQEEMPKVYFLGKKPPKILDPKESYAFSPILYEVYVRKKALSAYKNKYDKTCDIWLANSWHTFKPKELKKYTK